MKKPLKLEGLFVQIHDVTTNTMDRIGPCVTCIDKTQLSEINKNKITN